jgi:cytidine deaminase
MLRFDIQTLKNLAKEQTSHCRLTKSTTRVGCAVYTDKGNYYSGCNFDSEFGVTHHAETSAITDMVVHGSADEKILDVYIYCERAHFTPCGACRDHIKFFGTPKMTVHIDNGVFKWEYSIEELIPHYPER